MRRMIVGLVLGLFAAAAQAQTLPLPNFQGPSDPANTLNLFNTLIQEINAVLLPTFPSAAGGATATGSVSFPTASGGAPAVITTIGTATTVSLSLDPKGSGNIIFFGPNGTAGEDATDKGVIQIATATSWFPAKGLAGCPGGGPGTPASAAITLPGASPTVAGYFVQQDWLGRYVYLPGCR